MATVNPSISTIEGDGSVMQIVWTPLTSTNLDGAPVRWCQYADRSVQLSGTWGTATVVLQGSNDGTTWFTLTDPQTVAISKTADALEQVLEMTQFVRPLLSGGNGTTAVTANLLVRRANPMRT
jgi:hypothetical protein